MSAIHESLPVGARLIARGFIPGGTGKEGTTLEEHWLCPDNSRTVLYPEEATQLNTPPTGFNGFDLYNAQALKVVGQGDRLEVSVRSHLTNQPPRTLHVTYQTPPQYTEKITIRKTHILY